MRIVNDILDLARLESASLALELEETDVAGLVEDCAERLSAKANAKGLSLICDIGSGVPIVHCDRLRLRQVLNNLAENALKFTNSGFVKLSVALTDTGDNAATLSFVVEDSGVGIPEDLTPFLFQPFSQIDSSRVRGQGGTGLGLAICRILVEAMGGVLTARSEPNRGSRFIVEIPFAVAEAARQSAAGAQLTNSGRFVFAVNPDDQVMRIASRYLRDAGAHIVTVPALTDLNVVSNPETYGDGKPVVVIGPDAEAEDVEAASVALGKMLPRGKPAVVWLHSRQLGSASQLLRGGIRALHAYPLRRSEILGAVNDPHGPPADPTEAIKLTRLLRSDGHSEGGLDDARAEGRVALVAEDNPVNQEVLRQQLSILGWACDVAATGHIALQMLDQNRYAMLLCDCHMPGMDGFELTKVIRDREQITRSH
ncbi:MAG: ATP-binding protein, partial [Rhodospirillaceae bacterium]